MARLPRLETLELRVVELTPEQFGHLAKCRALISLDLASSNLDDEGLERICHSKTLLELDLSLTEITNKGAVHFSRLKSLTNLNVDATPLGNSAIQSMARRGLRNCARGRLRSNLPDYRLYLAGSQFLVINFRIKFLFIF